MQLRRFDQRISCKLLQLRRWVFARRKIHSL